MIDNSLKQLLISYKHRKDIERLFNCVTYFSQFEKMSIELLDKLIKYYEGK
jgi:hypothetical protein